MVLCLSSITLQKLEWQLGNNLLYSITICNYFDIKRTFVNDIRVLLTVKQRECYSLLSSMFYWSLVLINFIVDNGVRYTMCCSTEKGLHSRSLNYEIIMHGTKNVLLGLNFEYDKLISSKYDNVIIDFLKSLWHRKSQSCSMYPCGFRSTRYPWTKIILFNMYDNIDIKCKHPFVCLPKSWGNKI